MVTFRSFNWDNLSPAERGFANKYFQQSVCPVLTPLAVGQQMEREGAKFGIEAAVSRSGRPVAPVQLVADVSQMPPAVPPDQV
jgi:hypothetical protein